ncbi:MAG TPA: hypothetical protein VJT73_02410 [Polyangiaceae bacterium]|nr:hypothetical protein [Polyangiaceae bacterium]
MSAAMRALASGEPPGPGDFETVFAPSHAHARRVIAFNVWCDWSANDFAYQWLHLYKRDLEQSYSSCLESAGNDNRSSIAPKDRVDVDALDAYFARKAAQQAQAQAALRRYELHNGQPGFDGARKYGQTLERGEWATAPCDPIRLTRRFPRSKKSAGRLGERVARPHDRAMFGLEEST